MEARIVIKNLDFIESDKKDIKIKLYHNKINLLSDIIWDYENKDTINWKFIIDYTPSIPIDFIILENDVLDQNNIIGHGIINKNDKLNISEISNSLFPEPYHINIQIERNSIITCILNIELYIILKSTSTNYKCGSGWSEPDNYPQLSIFPYKNRNDIFQNIRLIENTFSDELENETYSNAFVRIINDDNNKPPICFGIIAPDNYGKSRLLQNLNKKLSLTNNNVVINFNPWNFEAADIIWASILISIHDALELKFGKFNLKLLRINKYFFPNSNALFMFILKMSIPLILLIILCIYGFVNNFSSIFISISLGASFLYFIRNYYSLITNFLFSISDLINNKINKPDWKQKLGFMNEIKEEFLDFINPVIKNYNCKLILLIDDLDKCSIEKIYSVIKVLSLLKYSDCPIYIFLSYDSVKINDAITSYYKNKNLINSYEGKNLLNKLINIPFCLPEKSIVENITLIEKYLKENVTTIKTPIFSSKKMEENTSLRIDDIYIKSESPKNINVNYFNFKETDKNKLNQIELILQNNINLSFYQLENYYKYIIKMEYEEDTKQINKLKKIIYQKFIELKKDFSENLYIGLDNEEINLIQNILEETKYSGYCLNNSQIIKIINLYAIARFLLPTYLKNKKNKLLHLLLITENWHDIMIQIYEEIKKIKINLNSEKIKECFENKELLFFYINNEKINKNDELIIYLTKFEIKIIDYIELEKFIINLDRCLII